MIFVRIIFLIVFTGVIASPGFAQLERELADPDRPVEHTFMAPRNITVYTVESLNKGELHYSIMHTFGEVKTGVQNLWGVDQGANVRFSFEYGLTDRVSLGFGRSSMDKVYDFTGRAALLNQSSTNSMPVSVSIIPTIGINTSDFGFLDEDYSFSDRLAGSVSLSVARKFSDKVSLQITPMVAHFNRVGSEVSIADPTVNTYYSVAAGGRFKINNRTALSLQYVPAITESQNLDDNIAIGIDIETGGHVFQMFFTTSNALNDSYLLASPNGNFFDREFRFGFNVNRLFKIN